MFIAREEEKKDLLGFINSAYTRAALIYGVRRVGKTSLILECLKETQNDYVYYECIRASEEKNLEILSRRISAHLNLPNITFNDFPALFDFIGSLNRKIIIVLDEYQYLKQGFLSGDADSFFQHIIDGLSQNLKIILSGSYISIMKELLEYGNPLFGRFDLVEKLNPMDYYDSSLFYPNKSIRDKISFYAVFGGSPLASSSLNIGKSINDNIKELLLSSKGNLRLFVEFVLFSELRKIDLANSILASLGNGKKRYTEIESSLNISSNGTLAKQLLILEEMEVIKKVVPINCKNDKRKTFYAISDNLIRFYYCYIYGYTDEIERLGVDSYFSSYIEPSLDTYISYRFEDIGRQYFSRLAHLNRLYGVRDIGSYWYDDKKRKKNGEFDIVIAYDDGYEIWEAKFLKKPMQEKQIEKEVTSIKEIENLKIKAIGFISTSGYENMIFGYKYLKSEDLYQLE